MFSHIFLTSFVPLTSVIVAGRLGPGIDGAVTDHGISYGRANGQILAGLTLASLKEMNRGMRFGN